MGACVDSIVWSPCALAPIPGVCSHSLLQSVGRRCTEGLSLELLTVIAVNVPASFSLKPFPRLDLGRGAHHRNEILMATDFDPQHAEAGFTALERDPFNKSTDVLYGRVGFAGVCVGRRVWGHGRQFIRLVDGVKGVAGMYVDQLLACE